MLKPLHNNVVLEKEEKEARTQSGIILSEKKDEQQVGRVVAVGEGKYVNGTLVKTTVKVGDRVVYKKYGTTEVELDKKEYLILSEDDILAVVE
ncbi:MAG: co-chaperone GroES [Erysipelotrichaceae bacterium]|nr:co-chaperone GroES [Erysipelotrichaceae bacterium]